MVVVNGLVGRVIVGRDEDDEEKVTNDGRTPPLSMTHRDNDTHQ